jgi:hypothetical protein
MRSINESWEVFEKKLGSLQQSQNALKQMKCAYYSGALDLFVSQTKIIKESKDDEDKGKAAMEKNIREILGFFSGLCEEAGIEKPFAAQLED